MVDLEGYTIFPGLVNAHDHLELNHYPRSKFREVYDNAHQWGEDMDARLDTEPYKSLRAYPLRDRLFIGGLKNLLCGATTVAHHGPPHKPLFAKDFPVRVLQKYGWAHSLHFSTDDEIVASYKSTPADALWFIHLAEGTDDVARSEYQRLKELGCIGKNTVIVHGIGMTQEDEWDFKSKGGHLVLCPTTNLYLLGKTLVDGSSFLRSMMMLGSDSRLTAQGDLLDELRLFGELYPDNHAPSLVISEPEDTLKIYDKRVQDRRAFGGSRFARQWEPGRHADFIAIKDDYATLPRYMLVHARRSDIALIVKDGIPQIGDVDLMVKFRQIEMTDAVLDDKSKSIHIYHTRRIHQCTLKEPGLEVDALPTKRFWLI